MSIRDAFRFQSQACTALGSPFMGRLMALCADRLKPGTAAADRILSWPGDYRTHADSVPLRLAGALHALRLDGLALAEVYPPHDVPDDALWAAVEDAISAHSDRVMRWLDSAPQTNEVRRSAALLPVLTLVTERFQRPLSLIELGCSGGLNLQADQMALDAGDRILGDGASPLRLKPDWSGPAPVMCSVTVASRFGIDLNPIDSTTNAGKLTLLAYLWPCLLYTSDAADE